MQPDGTQTQKAIAKTRIAFSKHKKGSSGSGGVWALRAPIHFRTQRPNLHTYKGMKFCTKCLRVYKPKYEPVTPTEASTEAAAAQA